MTTNEGSLNGVRRTTATDGPELTHERHLYGARKRVGDEARAGKISASAPAASGQGRSYRVAARARAAPLVSQRRVPVGGPSRARSCRTRAARVDRRHDE